MVEEKVSLAVQDLLDGGRQDLVIVAVEPQVGVLSEIEDCSQSFQFLEYVTHYL